MGERAAGRLCASPWPATPRTVPSGTSACSGGSPASVVGLLRCLPASHPAGLGTEGGPSCGPYFCVLWHSLNARLASSSWAAARSGGRRGLRGLTAPSRAPRAPVPRRPAVLGLRLRLPAQLLRGGRGRGGVLRGAMRERLRVRARPLLGRRPVRARRALPLLPPTPALRPRGHRAPAVQPVVGPRALPALRWGWRPSSPLRPLPKAIASTCLPFWGPLTSAR